MGEEKGFIVDMQGNPDRGTEKSPEQREREKVVN